MKKLILVTTMIALVLSFGIANALDGSKIPQHLQDSFTAETGTKANFAIWFPIVPEVSQLNWANMLIVSNFNSFGINVQCQFTNYSNEQTTKSYVLPFFGKRLITLSQSGFEDNLYDIFCLSDQMFGAAALLLEGGNVAAAWPPIF